MHSFFNTQIFSQENSTTIFCIFLSLFLICRLLRSTQFYTCLPFSLIRLLLTIRASYLAWRRRCWTCGSLIPRSTHRLFVLLLNLDLLLVNLFYNAFKSCGDVRTIECWSFKQSHLLFFCVDRCIFDSNLSIFRQVRLIPYQHCAHMFRTMVTKLLQPFFDILKWFSFSDIIDKQSSNCSFVVTTGNSSVSVLTSCIPYLGLNHVSWLSCNCFSCELNSDGSFGFQWEFIFAEAC